MGEAPGRLRDRLHQLYYGTGETGRRFRYAVLAFDLATVVFVITTSFLPRHPAIGVMDVTIGLITAVEFVTRALGARRPWREALSISSIADLIAIVSFLAPLQGEGGGFLRILRTLRLLHSFGMRNMLREDFPVFRQREEVAMAAAHLFVFVFVMTGLVYETHRDPAGQIRNYADALYFTITTLTTTGFGDITLPDTMGRLLSVVIMIAGVTLFLRLAQTLFRPHKVRFPCPSCGLQRHDSDAVHCKACGVVLNIPDEGH